MNANTRNSTLVPEDVNETHGHAEFWYNEQSLMTSTLCQFDNGGMDISPQTIPDPLWKDLDQESNYTSAAGVPEQMEIQYDLFPAGFHLAQTDSYEADFGNYPPDPLQEGLEPHAPVYDDLYPVSTRNNSIVEQSSIPEHPSLPLARYTNEGASWAYVAPVLNSNGPAGMPLFQTRSPVRNEGYPQGPYVEPAPDCDALNYQQLQPACEKFQTQGQSYEVPLTQGSGGSCHTSGSGPDPRGHSLDGGYLRFAYDEPPFEHDTSQYITRHSGESNQTSLSQGIQYITRHSGESNQTSLSQGISGVTPRPRLQGSSPGIFPSHGDRRSPASHVVLQAVIPDNYPSAGPFASTAGNSLVGSSHERISSRMGHKASLAGRETQTTGYVHTQPEVAWITDREAMSAPYAGAQDSHGGQPELVLVPAEPLSAYRTAISRTRRSSAHPLQIILPASSSSRHMTPSSDGDRPSIAAYQEFDQNMNSRNRRRTRYLSPKGRKHASEMRKVGSCRECRRKKSKVSFYENIFRISAYTAE
ncbi:MAG: hypothetical protein Q9187_004580 [Circinaria calcarea]